MSPELVHTEFVEVSKDESKDLIMWHVYILSCSNGAYYIGSTNDLERRLQEHFSGRGGHYTKTNRPVKLLYTERYPTSEQARNRETQLKGWTRRKKAAIIAGDLEKLNKL